jgi:hypothetical protein
MYAKRLYCIVKVEIRLLCIFVTHTPCRLTIAVIGKFEPILQKFGGPNAIKEWEELNRVLEPVKVRSEYTHTHCC